MREPLRLHVFTRNGIPNDRNILEYMYLTDLEDEPFWSEVRVTDRGIVECWPRQPGPIKVHVFWEIEDFGKIYAVADNDGLGYIQGRDIDIDLNHDLASSRLRRTQRRLDELKPAYAFAQATMDRVAQAQALLQQAESLPPGEARYSALARAHTQGTWALEEIEVSKARQDVARMPAERRHALRFGCNAFAYQRSEAYRQRFAELLDFATVPFYRLRMEPTEGHVDWKTRDDLLDWLKEAGITPKGHPLFWGHEAGQPTWMKRLNYATLRQVVRRQLMETVSRYKDRIKVWDIINEAHDWPPANVLFFRRDEQLDLTDLTSRTVHEADPEAIRIVNSCCTWSEYVAWREREEQMSVYAYLKLVLDRAIDFEVVGLQMYYPRRDMADISAQLDKFAALGKPIHITELGTPSAVREEWRGRPLNEGWWHGPWSERIQADWAEQYYLIALSKPSIEAITWWDMADPAFIHDAGFLDETDRPKEVFDRLKNLIAEVRQG